VFLFINVDDVTPLVGQQNEYMASGYCEWLLYGGQSAYSSNRQGSWL